MPQNADDFFPFQDKSNDPHLRPAFETLQRINLIHLVHQLRPGPAAGFPIRGIIDVFNLLS